MTGRIAKAFAKARDENRAALIPFMTAGYPAADSTVPMLAALADGGADIIELGVPFSDPSADGRAIARASEVALANGITLQKTLRQIGEFRQTNKQMPIVLMGYANSFFRCGREKFMADAKQNGADGLIVVDFSDDERPLWQQAGQAAGVDVISLIAPTTSKGRQMQLAAASSGFVYFIALKGITGARHLSVDDLAPRIDELKKAAKTPIAAGFGIRDAKQARQLAKVADGIVVGSRLTEVIGESSKDNACANAAAFVGELARAVR